MSHVQSKMASIVRKCVLCAVHIVVSVCARVVVQGAKRFPVQKQFARAYLCSHDYLYSAPQQRAWISVTICILICLFLSICFGRGDVVYSVAPSVRRTWCLVVDMHTRHTSLLRSLEGAGCRMQDWRDSPVIKVKAQL